MKTFSLAAVSLLALAPYVYGADINSKDFSAGDLFRLDKVWNLDLVFTPAQWAAMQPRFTGSGSGGFLLGAEGQRNGLSAGRGILFDWTHAALTVEGKEFPDVAVRIKGNGTFSNARNSKVSFKLDLNKYVKGQKLAKISKLNLANNTTDAGWMNEELAFALYRDAGVPAPRTSYAKVYVTVTGKVAKTYLGLYSLVEDVDDAFLKEQFKENEGALLKPVTAHVFEDMGTDWKAYNQIYDPKTDLTDAQKKRIFDLCRLVTKGDDKEFAAKLGDLIDTDEFARYLAVTVWLADADGILGVGQNYYVYLHPDTNKFSFIAWDQDHSFGQMARVPAAQYESLTITNPQQSGNRLVERFLNTPVFREKYLGYMRQYNTTLFKPERLFKQVDALAPVIRPAVAEESSSMLAAFDRTVADEEPARSYNERLKTFVKNRVAQVQDQLDGKSKGTEIFGGNGGMIFGR